MADGMEKAAEAFEAVINSEATPVAKPRNAVDRTEGPVDTIFKNAGQLDPDTEAKGGGDDEPDPEEAIYADDEVQAKKGPRDPSKGDDEDREGDDADADKPDGDPDDEDEPEEEEEESAVLAQEVEVNVDGEPKKVTVKEALEGYVRTETFHQRMNQLDEAKKIVRRAAADAVQNYEYSMQVAKQMEAHMAQMIPAEPDWDKEFAADPVKARQLQQYYEKANGFKSALQAQMAEASKKVQESNMIQTQAFAEEEAGKFEAMNRKYWTDPKRKAKDLSSMRKTGLAAGFAEEELSQVYDSRMLQVLLKASKYDRMMAAKPKPVVRAQAKPIPPGAGSAKQRTAHKGVTSAMKRLNRTGSIDDAAAVFDQILAKQG